MIYFLNFLTNVNLLTKLQIFEARSSLIVLKVPLVTTNYCANTVQLVLDQENFLKLKGWLCIFLSRMFIFVHLLGSVTL